MMKRPLGSNGIQVSLEDNCEPTTDGLHIKVMKNRQRMCYMNVSCNRQRTVIKCRLLV